MADSTVTEAIIHIAAMAIDLKVSLGTSRYASGTGFAPSDLDNAPSRQRR
jgi:hypothetical protein